MKTSIQIQNHKTPILTLGNSTKKNPIIFIPGFNMRINDYRNYLNFISKERTIYGIEIYKTKPRANSISEQVEIILEIINLLKIKKFDLVGNSFGGGVAFEIAAKNKKVNKIVAINPLLNNEYDSKEYIRRFLKAARYKFLKKFIFYLTFSIRIISNLYSLLKNLKSINKYKLNKKINNSSLILLGEKDEFFNQKQINKKLFKDIKVEIKKGRHLNLINFYKEIGKETLKFLNKA